MSVRMLSVLVALCNLHFVAAPTDTPQTDRLWHDVPRRHPMYRDLNAIVKAGLVQLPSVCYPSRKGAKWDAEHRAYTRYEITIIAHRAKLTLDELVAKRDAKLKDRKMVAAVKSMQRLRKEFHEELQLLDGSLTRPTPEVKADGKR
jgi:hypothetical protein